MKAKKTILSTLAMAVVFSGCNMNNTTKGGLIGGAGGGAVGAGLGAAIGALVNGSSGAKLGAAIGAGVGVAGGTTAGVLIGKKMDKAKAAAEAVANAQVETTTDKNGLEAVKVTFDNGILFKVGKSDLQTAAQTSLRQFANNVLNVYTDCDVAICGFASSDGSDATNLTLSQNRANAVRSYLTNSCGVSTSQIKSTIGYGEDPNYLIYDANGKEDREASRRVEVYLYASEAMINAANAGTLQ
ncbi:MAG: OmpA family protein [Prevotellaceae bacterium]|nr:OmpA family protein [Prevotellaceae bacterium]